MTTLMRALNVNIQRWSAWSPGVESAEDWRHWSRSGAELPVEGKMPSLKFLPAMLRRRLSPTGKMALKVAYDCGVDKEPIRTVFSSRHGEANQTIPLLHDIVRQEPVSPTKFSLSVHNTASGLYTITAKNTAPATAIAARLDTFEVGFLEAAAILATGREERVLVVYSDAPLKPPFDVLVDYEPPVAGAFLLSARPTDLILSLSMRPRGQEGVSKGPHFLAFMRLLLNPDHQPLELTTDRLTWTWARNAS